jgi:hypothetical protein
MLSRCGEEDRFQTFTTEFIAWFFYCDANSTEIILLDIPDPRFDFTVDIPIHAGTSPLLVLVSQAKYSVVAAEGNNA